MVLQIEADVHADVQSSKGITTEDRIMFWLYTLIFSETIKLNMVIGLMEGIVFFI